MTAQLPIKRAWQAVTTSARHATQLSYDDVAAIALLMRDGVGDGVIGERYRVGVPRVRKLRRLLGLPELPQGDRHDRKRRARLEAATRDWIAGTDAQEAVAARWQVGKGSLSRVARELGLSKPEDQQHRNMPLDLDACRQAQRRQAELDRLCAARQKRVLAEYKRRLALRRAEEGLPA